MGYQMAQTPKHFEGRSPYADGASSLAEHNRLIEKGKAIASAIADGRRALEWDTPPQAPFYGTTVDVDAAIPFLEGLIEELKDGEK